MARKKSDFNLIVDLIKKDDKFVILTHVQPDGDAFGSVLGLAMLLKKMGKNVFLSIDKDMRIPPQYSFLPGVELIKSINDYHNDFVNFIVLDCGSIERLGSWEQIAKNAKNIINIDHHKSNTRFGTLNYIDEKSSSSSEMVYKLSLNLGVEIDKDIALCLYVGIVTDTGKFQYSNTTSKTFKNALKLIKYDISPTYVFENVYERASLGCLNLLGKILNSARFLKDA
ncbi:MAG: bifunctional oligoribonuclease/PAP phosphatase NrnA [Actinobacteria bacterium]|nr:bifunctional oligoribonuclease/PAP phosphatase NrnA [Actinomycetota bacterium]